jgi:hypothetical protein
MGLSSNSIIHFTSEKDALKSILKNNFRTYYCKEKIAFGNIYITYVAPMVCFCDIPLSEVKDHISKYGSYGLGLTKEWAENKGLNPVLYLDKNSILSISYLKIYEKFILDPKTSLFDLSIEQRLIIDILRYIKNYQDDLERNGKVYKNYRFSDEREWRYVPDITNNFPLILSESISATEKSKETVNNFLRDVKLEFDPNDIKYIIINREDEISEFLSLLKDSKGKKYSYNDVEKLMTRIITTDQIISDF